MRRVRRAARTSPASGNLRALLWHIYGLLRREPAGLQGDALASALVLARAVLHSLLEAFDVEHVAQLLEAGTSLSESGHKAVCPSLTRAVVDLLLHQPGCAWVLAMAWIGQHAHGCIVPATLCCPHRAAHWAACQARCSAAARMAGPRTSSCALSDMRVPPRAAYLVRLEAVQLLVVLTSSQLYSSQAAGPPEAHPFTTALMQQPDLAPGLVQVGPSAPCVHKLSKQPAATAQRVVGAPSSQALLACPCWQHSSMKRSPGWQVAPDHSLWRRCCCSNGWTASPCRPGRPCSRLMRAPLACCGWSPLQLVRVRLRLVTSAAGARAAAAACQPPDGVPLSCQQLARLQAAPLTHVPTCCA